MNKNEHWENVFATKAGNEVSWFQEYPKLSVDFVKALELPLDAKIIDVGGGDSYFIDSLLEFGYTNLTLLDISSHAIERIKKRLGDKAANVNFIVSDVMNFNPTIHYDYWHDRACFHFLTQREEVSKYADITSEAIVKGGSLVLGTFSDDGPKKCSGLDITQYNQESLRLIFERDFELTGCFTEDHKTPFDTVQNFLFCSFRKR